MAHSLLIQARKDASGRMPLEDQLRRWGCRLTLPNGSHTHTPLKETVGGPKQEGNNSDHLELERIREAGAYVDDTVLTQCRPPDIHLPAPSGLVPKVQTDCPDLAYLPCGPLGSP